MQYNAYINVEICCQSLLIKYLFKYASKELDRMKLMMKYMHIVIVDLSAPMKMFDVFSNFQFPIYSRTPTIERLQGHIFAFSAKCYLLKQQLSLSCS
jgi:hypothetical protein